MLTLVFEIVALPKDLDSYQDDTSGQAYDIAFSSINTKSYNIISCGIALYFQEEI